MSAVLIRAMQRVAMWLVWNGPPLGNFAPMVFDFAMSQKGTRVNKDHPHD